MTQVLLFSINDESIQQGEKEGIFFLRSFCCQPEVSGEVQHVAPELQPSDKVHRFYETPEVKQKLELNHPRSDGEKPLSQASAVRKLMKRMIRFKYSCYLWFGNCQTGLIVL